VRRFAKGAGGAGGRRESRGGGRGGYGPAGRAQMRCGAWEVGIGGVQGFAEGEGGVWN